MKKNLEKKKKLRRETTKKQIENSPSILSSLPRARIYRRNKKGLGGICPEGRVARSATATGEEER